MTKALLLAWSSPTSNDTADTLDRWYDDTHIPPVKDAVGSISKATRFRVADPSGGSTPPRFLTIYELADADVEAASRRLMDAARSGRLVSTDAMDKVDHPPALEWYVEHP